jgi:hypothetical protein
VKSAIASLRSLTLPFGATSGARIVLDGVNGEIRIYDNNNDLLMQLDAEGFKVFDGDGNLRIWLAIPGGLNAAYSVIEWYTKRTDQTLPGFISVYDTVARNRMVISPGENDDRGTLEWTIVPEDADILQESMLQAVSFTLDHADNLRPTVDLTGASAPNEIARPYTVVYDLFYGTPNSFGDTPTMIRKYPRGEVGIGTNSTDINLSTTAGVDSTYVACTVNNVRAGHRYKVTVAGGHSFVSGGSGFTVGDFWEFTIERDVNASGVWGQLPGIPITVRVRANVAIAARFPMPVLIGYYHPSAAANSVLFRARAQKGGGAGTVTTGLGTNGGASPFSIVVEDLGTASPE